MEKNVAYYMSLPYPLKIIPSKAGGWVILVGGLEGCGTQADRWEDIPTRIEETKQGWLEVALEMGMPIPEPEPS